MRLMQFDYTISHIPGKELVTADTLSRAPLGKMTEKDISFGQDVSMFVNHIVNHLPATPRRLKEIQEAQQEDETSKKCFRYIQSGWPVSSKPNGEVKPLIPFRAEMNVQEGLIFRGDRIWIPQKMRTEILDKIHAGHQGIVKCKERARQSVWWPTINQDIEKKVMNCPICTTHRIQHAEPLIPTALPDYPWQKVATDLFQWKGMSYLLVVDYYSRFIEIAKFSVTSSGEVIRHLKSIFARCGIPEELVSDNGPQYAS